MGLVALEEFCFLREFSRRCVVCCPLLVQEEGRVNEIGPGELKLGEVGITSGEGGVIWIVVDQRQSALDAGGEQDVECDEEDGVNHRWSVVVSND